MCMTGCTHGLLRLRRRRRRRIVGTSLIVLSGLLQRCGPKYLIECFPSFTVRSFGTMKLLFLISQGIAFIVTFLKHSLPGGQIKRAP